MTANRLIDFVVEKEAYLLELSRHVILIPVCVEMVKRPEDWWWSSYMSMNEAANVPERLDTDWLLS